MSARDSQLNSRVAFLQASLLFLDLHADELALLAELCQPIAFEPGQIVYLEQDSGDCLYIVEEGVVEVLHGPGEGGSEVSVIATMERGEFFGEMSMLEKSTRSATVRACTEVKLLMLSTDDFYSFAKIFKNGFTVVIINIARILSQRLRQTTGRLKGM